ncbi:MAG: alpha-ketoacid dehydrogenase subunit beta [Chlamydiia bacterium]|nr:alpha-ketoacid dehydrogenase subunit beta [Chlamydiia bacterium]
MINMIQALNQTLMQRMGRDERIVVFGEDCGFFGGVFRVTSGLQQKFGKERAFDAPLCEQGIVGFAIGMAQKGMKPCCEIQFADYIFPAYDQIVNELAKMRYRTGGQYSAPVVIRTPYGGGIHGGLYHSQSPEAQFLHTPGLRVVVPSGPYEAKGLLITALRGNDPVLFLEPKRIYRSLKENVPEEEYEIPFGKADITRIGSQVTLVGWGAQHHQNMQAAAECGLDVEVINLRTLSPWDKAAVFRSVEKTGRLLIAHEAPKTCGFGAEIAAAVMEEAFLHLKAPVMRVAGLDTPFPHTLEKEYLPDAPRVVKALQEIVKY